MAQSKYRFKNIFGQPISKWEDIKPMGGSSDSFVIEGNSKFIAFPLA